MTAYYNEIDPAAAAWLRELIKAGAIAPGDVDERDIQDVRPDDLRGYAQCHFFAGIGVWSYALRRAGWDDDRPVWTGSCPCQPFSAAGKGDGFADERHLWPAFHHLIRECAPPLVLGEQVASKDGLAWLDLVHADLEAAGYASGAVDLCAAGVGAPHIRQRLWWVGERLADADDSGLEGWRQPERGRAPERAAGAGGLAGGLADAAPEQCDGSGVRRSERRAEHPNGGATGGMADTECVGRRGRQGLSTGRVHDGADAERQQGHDGPVSVSETGIELRRPGPTNGFWRSADWLYCRDGKWRPVEPGAQPLAHGAPARVVRLRGYGNAINAEAAKTFIESVMDVI